MAKSHSKTKARSKAVTIRVPEALLKRLMRLRQVDTQSELFHALLAEDDERFASLAALRETAGVVPKDAFDDRLL